MRCAPMMLAVVTCAMLVAPCLAAIPRPTFYLPLDGTDIAAVAGGSRLPVRNVTGQTDTILELLSRRGARFAAGKVGQCVVIGDRPLVYECAGNFRADEGTCSLWVCPEWRGDQRDLYSTLFGAADWGMVYKYQDQTSLTFATAKPDKDLYYDCGARDISAWRPGEWHHVMVTWSRTQDARRVYVDGALQGQAPFPFSREVKAGPLFVGAGCTMYPDPVAHAKLDEFALWDAPLDQATVRELYEAGEAGRPLWAVSQEAPARAPAAGGESINEAAPKGLPPPEQADPVVTVAGPHKQVSLNGWWQFLPSLTEPAALPAEGWGWSRVPGYWTSPGDTRGPDGQPMGQAWSGQAVSSCWVGCYQRSFTADRAWKGQQVALDVGGVDGLAQVFLNGRSLGWLPGWEPASYDVSARLRYGEGNTVTLILRTRGGSRIAGVYGDVGLTVTPGPRITDVTVTPRFEGKRVEFSCGVLNCAAGRDAGLVFDVAEAAEPGRVVRRLQQPCHLAAGAGRITASFDWPDAHAWTLEDPFLYQVTARLGVGDAPCDQTAPQRFGFREFARRGADLLLNGKPVHLRGHQIDLPWGDQMARVQELKPAGLNALELSGPICCNWYNGTPYQRRLFEDILNYCDEHGLIAAPVLPDLMVLRDRVFEPEVAALYRERLEKHIRTFGNHPSIGLWYMHFNLAGYLWYLAPSKLDGSYKPDDAGFRDKERFALEAQRMVAAVDSRPVYHHACGNFGDIFTSNLYLGPNSPLQEREEWPSRWAEKRSFPFIACEHCCMLIPYWFRPRQFPLDVVYAGEPIFDEISAMFLGPEAYAQITPEIFALYDVGQTPRGSRLNALIRNHPGYQAVKSLVARRSLRAWRTFGVSGIIFNAENWDFKDDQGKPLPMMQALARYFGDTDLDIVGPPGDWPSKDHAYFAGERMRKQVVLLNDLTRDIPVSLRWQLTGAGGRVYGEGQIEAVSRAGTPSFFPLEVDAPTVAERGEFTLTVTPISQPKQDFRPESFALQVFPRQDPARLPDVLVYDPAGGTKGMLAKAGVRPADLKPDSDLTQAMLVVVGRRAWDAGFEALARSLNLEAAIRGGLRLLVFEQTTAAPFALKLEETSTRDAFALMPQHPALQGLAAPDFHDLRGASDAIAPYPDAAHETQTTWPARCFKWGNRGVLATYVYDKPHYAPFRPVLECGFDLAQSPLLEARFGKGSVTLCQVDVTERYGADPVSTSLVDNLLRTPAEASGPASAPCRYLGDSARAFLAPFGIQPAGFQGGPGGPILVGTEPLAQGQAQKLQQAAEAGATVVLLPGSAAAGAFGLSTKEERLFLGKAAVGPLTQGLDAGDLYLKAWTTLQGIEEGNGWRSVVTPGLVATKAVGAGRVVACPLDPQALGQTRARIKALRLWSLLLANVGSERARTFLAAPAPTYAVNEWESIPPYMSW